MADALASLKDHDVPSALVLASRHWHLGVVGIVAARLVDRFQRPAIVMAINEQGIAKGSARTTGGFDLYQGLASCREMLEAFGGHPSALSSLRHCMGDEPHTQISSSLVMQIPQGVMRFRHSLRNLPSWLKTCTKM
jgi:hypothetical protein